MSYQNYHLVNAAMKRYQNLIFNDGVAVNDITMFEFPTEVEKAMKNDSQASQGYKLNIISAIKSHIFYSYPQSKAIKLMKCYDDVRTAVKNAAALEIA